MADIDKIIKELEPVEYRGIKLKDTLTDFFVNTLIEGKAEQSIIKDFSVLFKYIIFSPLGIGKFNDEKLPCENAVLFSSSTYRKNIVEIIRPVFEKFDENKRLLLVKNQTVADAFNTLGPFNNWDNFPRISIFDWLGIFFRNIIPIIFFVLKNVKELGFRLKIKLINNIVVNIYRIECLFKYFSLIKPAKIIVDTDKLTYHSLLILVGRQFNVPSATFVHGVLNYRHGYVPIVADKILVWGPRQKEILKNWSVPENEIKVGGAPQLQANTINFGKKQSVLAALNLNNGKPVVQLATNPVRHDLRESLIKIFCEATKGLQNEINAIVRIHPVEDKAFYRKYEVVYPHVSVFGNNEIAFDDALLISDCICLYNSSVSIDAMLNKIPVFVVNLNDPNSQHGKELAEHLNEYSAADESSLKVLLQKFITDADFKHEVFLKQQAYVKNYVAFIGEEAAQKSFEIVSSL